MKQDESLVLCPCVKGEFCPIHSPQDELTPEDIKTIIIGEIAFAVGTGWTEENILNVERIIDITLAKSHRTSPDREGIERLEITLCYALFAYNDGHITEGEMDLYRDYVTDQILALAKQYYHPSIKAQALQVELAKREGEERILNQMLPGEHTGKKYYYLPESVYQALKDK